MAIPLELRTDFPSMVVPSKKLTMPSGIPSPDVTVDLKVTDWFRFEGFASEMRFVAVLNPCTTWFSPGDVPGTKLPSPE